MTNILPRPNIKIETVEEPEIQYAATPELFVEIRHWLHERGGVPKKVEADRATYYDTKNYRLLREGIEYRVKDKGKFLRHDMKLPLDPHDRAVLPDKNNILWRNELKFKTPSSKPSLVAFWGQALLDPIKERLSRRFFDNELLAQFHSVFLKEKIDHETACGNGRVEYSMQSGHMETIDTERRTAPLCILELELREGSMESLLAEKEALESYFIPKGLALLPQRKVLMGFELLLEGMTEKQRISFEDAKARNTDGGVNLSTFELARERLLAFAA